MHHYVVAGLTIVGVLLAGLGPDPVGCKVVPWVVTVSPLEGGECFPCSWLHSTGAVGLLLAHWWVGPGLHMALYAACGGLGLVPIHWRTGPYAHVLSAWTGGSGLVWAPLRVGLGHSQLSSQLSGDCGCCQPNGEQQAPKANRLEEGFPSGASQCQCYHSRTSSRIWTSACIHPQGNFQLSPFSMGDSPRSVSGTDLDVFQVIDSVLECFREMCTLLFPTALWLSWT